MTEKKPEKKPEMSIDEVLSSIKKMVVDSEPPVLDLTDMVKDDGSVVKVGENESAESMGAFLKLAQENSLDENDGVKNKRETRPQQRINYSKPKEIRSQATTKDDVINEIFRDIATPGINQWIESNLAGLTGPLIEQSVRKWLDENLPRIAGDIIEREIRNLLKNHN